jgi:hypothetical protein
MFFIKQKSLVLDCFTHDAAAHELAPIAPLNSAVPDWWKALPNIDVNVFRPNVNMRKCVGFTSVFKNGFVIPMWSDLHIEVGPTGSNEYVWQYSDGRSNLVAHSADQWGGFVSSGNYQHVKLSVPWRFRTNKACSFSWMPATWSGVGLNHLKGVHVLPAIIDFFYQNTSNVNVLLERNNLTTFYRLPLFQPLVYGIPHTESKLKIKTHIVSLEEYEKISRSSGVSSSFSGGYYKAKKLRLSKKCPFSRG